MLFFDNICYLESLSYTFKETQVWHLKWLKSYLHFSRSLSRKCQRGAFIMLSKTPFLLSSLTHACCSPDFSLPGSRLLNILWGFPTARPRGPSLCR